MTEKMYDLSWKIDGDNIRLKQDAGIDEVHVIDLHPAQLKLLAEQAGLLNLATGSQSTSSAFVTLERRFRIVTEKLKDVVENVGYRQEIFEQCGSGMEYLTILDSVVTLADEFLKDVGNAGPPTMPAQSFPSDAGDDLMFHLEVVCDEGDATINLYQTQVQGSGGSDEHIVLHPLQAAWLGRRLLAMTRNENTEAITVTPPATAETPKLGRPPTGEAQSNAERQQAYRDRKANEKQAGATESAPFALA
ncbi:MAG: hypothetical protein IPO13_14925 [Rhodocyclaceae bacterium]|nr:hypothetical protein [Rhodocyclaceae bacterium]